MTEAVYGICTSRPSQVDPRKRASIDEVNMHSFLRGGNTAAMDEEALNHIKETLSSVNDKVCGALQHE